MVDYLMEYKSNIIFHCGDLDYMFNQTGGKKPINLKDFKNSGPLIQQLKKEYCLGNEWNNSKDSKRPGFYIQGSWDRQGGRY